MFKIFKNYKKYFFNKDKEEEQELARWKIMLELYHQDHDEIPSWVNVDNFHIFMKGMDNAKKVKEQDIADHGFMEALEKL